MTASVTFELNDIEWIYQESREITSSRNPPQRVAVGVESARARCPSCGNEWYTTEGRGPGQFRSAADCLMITCPHCGAEGRAYPDSR